MIEQQGVKLNRKTTDLIGPGQTLRPLKDYLLIRPLDWKPSRLIDIAGSDRPTLRGVVVAAGPGKHPWLYNADKSRRRESKVFVKTQVRPGDTVELGGLELGGYSFPEILVDGQLHFICQEADVVGYESP